MANTSHKKVKTVTTAVGKVYFPRLFVPGEFEGQSTGFTVDVVFEPDEEKRLIKLAEETLQEGKNDPQFKGKKWTRPFLPNTKTEKDDEVFKGATKFRFKKNDTYRDKSTGETKLSHPPAVFDMKGNPVTIDPNIGNGSLVRVAFKPQAYYASPTVHGVRFYMEAVQLVEVKPYDRDALGYGFELNPDADTSFNTSEAYAVDSGSDSTSGEGGDF